MTNDEKTEKLLQNFCYDTECIALYTNKESAPRLFALLASMGFVWGSGEPSVPLNDEDLIFLDYGARKITHLPLSCIFDKDYDNTVYYSAEKFLDLVE